MQMKDEQIRLAGVIKRVKKRVDEERPDIKVDEKALKYIITVFFEEVSSLLYAGKRVIVENFVSFYTKPIKRRCSDPRTGEVWMTYRRRMRWKPAKAMKNKVESDME